MLGVNLVSCFQITRLDLPSTIRGSVSIFRAIVPTIVVSVWTPLFVFAYAFAHAFALYVHGFRHELRMHSLYTCTSHRHICSHMHSLYVNIHIHLLAHAHALGACTHTPQLSTIYQPLKMHLIQFYTIYVIFITYSCYLYRCSISWWLSSTHT